MSCTQALVPSAHVGWLTSKTSLAPGEEAPSPTNTSPARGLLGRGRTTAGQPAAPWQHNRLSSHREIPGFFQKQNVPFAAWFWWGSCQRPVCINNTRAGSRGISSVVCTGLLRECYRAPRVNCGVTAILRCPSDVLR